MQLGTCPLGPKWESPYNLCSQLSKSPVILAESVLESKNKRIKNKGKVKKASSLWYFLNDQWSSHGGQPPPLMKKALHVHDQLPMWYESDKMLLQSVETRAKQIPFSLFSSHRRKLCELRQGLTIFCFWLRNGSGKIYTCIAMRTASGGWGWPWATK